MSIAEHIIYFSIIFVLGIIVFGVWSGIISAIIATNKDNHGKKDADFIYEKRTLIIKPLLRKGKTEKLLWNFRKSKDGKIYQVKKQFPNYTTMRQWTDISKTTYYNCKRGEIKWIY